MHFGKSRLIFRLASQLYKDPDIFNLTVEPVPGGQGLLHDRPLLENFLRSLIIVPKTGGGDPGFKFLNIFPQAVYVKETPVSC
ncbi:hypothetical protein JCM15764A_15310 [Geotalea toluenoxydans]